MSLVRLKNRFIDAAPKFAQIIQPAYFANKHSVLTKNGYKIPIEKDIVDIITGLVESIKDDTDSASSGGIILEIEKDEDGNILDGSIGYQETLFSLLGEELISNTDNYGANDEFELTDCWSSGCGGEWEDESC